MTLAEHLSRPFSHWMAGEGADADVVVSTRVRLARNLRGYPFPEYLRGDAAVRLLDRVADAMAVLGSEWDVYRLGEVDTVDCRVLVEKHLISPQHARERRFRGIALNESESGSIMINEEDHLRIQYLEPGLCVDAALEGATNAEDALGSRLDFAFDEQKGYLSACPTNVGTGLRVSVMLHLPALTLTGRAPRVWVALGKLGITVRGLYGEGTDAAGNLFQISNQVTLGPSEAEIAASLVQVTRQVVEQERNARELLLTESRQEIADRVGRAYGVLRHAHLISAEEAMRLLSDVRLGVESRLLERPERRKLNELLVVTLPGYLDRNAGRPLGRKERWALRAEWIRERVA